MASPQIGAISPMEQGQHGGYGGGGNMYSNYKQGGGYQGQGQGYQGQAQGGYQKEQGSAEVDTIN